ncbi:MAG: tetratricopeptide repeat protein, partial [Verrucomicrobiales bacterium]|nr:tetratricopeptide repeat protein [Verrucomicrobiales bacterium]
SVEEEALLQDAIRMAPQGLPEQAALAHDALARFFVRAKRYEEALAEMQTAVTLSPRNAELQYFLGVALNSLNRYAEAVPHLTKAHELAPRHAEYLIALATVHRDAGRIDEAFRAARDLVALDPENREYLGLLQQLQSVRP